MIDTAKLTHESVRLHLTGHELLVIDTSVSHTHGGNEYNKRREECEAALSAINESAGEAKYDSLSQLTPEDFDNYEDLLPKKLVDRAKHVVTENERVKRAADSFREGNVERAGKLFYASHSSLRDLYEVSSVELDFLVDFARKEGIPGARMTGGGFGGSTIHLVPEDRVEAYSSAANREFRSEFGVGPKCFRVQASNGAKIEPVPGED